MESDQMKPAALRILVLAVIRLLGASPVPAQIIHGAVVDSASGTAVKGGYIALLNPEGHALGGTQTDSMGRFTLSAPTAGRYLLRASHIGYENATSDPIEVRAPGTVSIQFRLAPKPIQVDQLSISTESRLRHLEQGGFYRRRSMGFGRYITRDRIEVSTATRTTDLLHGQPGVDVVVVDPLTGDTDVVMRGGAKMSLRGKCFPSVAIDGSLVRSGGVGVDPGLDTLLPHPSEIEAIEIYPGAAGLPAQLAGSTSPCGALLVWTRR